MWISEDHTITEMVEKGIFKSEFFDEHFATLVNGLKSRDLVEICEVARLRRELIDPRQYSNRIFNYLSLANIQSDTGELIDFKPRRGKEIGSQCKIFRPNDLLYGRLRPYLNKCYQAKGQVKEGICTGECIVVVPDKTRIVPDYLHAVLLSKFTREQVKYIQTGSSRPRIQEDAFMKLRIPLLPISQQSIVANLQTTITNLVKRKSTEREAILRIGRQNIEKIILGEKTKIPDLTKITVPGEQVYENPLPLKHSNVKT